MSCLVITAVLIQTAETVGAYVRGGGSWPEFVLAGIRMLFGAFMHVALLVIWLFIVSQGLRGKWHGTVAYTPACVHYSMAWFPATALALVFAVMPRFYSIGGDFLYFVFAVLAIAGVCLWSAWLWTSISESERIPWVAFRLVALAALIIVTMAQIAAHGADLQQLVWNAIISPT